MKRTSYIIFTIAMVFSLCYCSVFADSQNVQEIVQEGAVNLAGTVENEDVVVSDVMTFEEMVASCAEDSGVSYAEMYEKLAGMRTRTRSSTNDAEIGYRTFSVYFDVTNEYRPHINYYCETTEGGHFFNITSIYYMTLVRSYNGISKEFTGEICGWLRTGNKIQYLINGTFYNNGSTYISAEMDVSVGIDGLANVGYAITGAYETSYYAYFFDDGFKSYS